MSTPLTLCLVVLGRHVDRLEYRHAAWGNRPALTPIENFYQPMLADDMDEALQQAELLKRSLTAYYDEVALEGLQLAANDAQRGVLGAERLERIKRSVRSPVYDLGGRDDGDPHPVEKEEAQGVASKAERDIPAPAAECAAPDADTPRLADCFARLVSCRTRPARRGRFLNPGAASGQARLGRACCGLRIGFLRRHHKVGCGGRCHGVHQLSGD